MSMLNIHAAAIAGQLPAYHEFLSRYSKHSRTVYGFVEGKGDPVFYRGFVEHLLPDGWEIELWPAGNRTRVYQVEELFDWRRFPRRRICFFVDRDLADLIPERLRTEPNIYVTDDYAIENSVVNVGVCRRVLTELFDLGLLPHNELDAVLHLFHTEFERFLLTMVTTMSWVLYWRRKRIPANLDEIKMPDLFTVNSGTLQVNANPRGMADIVTYIHSRCQVTLDTTINITGLEQEFLKDDNYRRFIRGKYVFWFLIEFCKSVHASATSLFPSCARQPTLRVTISATNGMSVIGNRSRIPGSLRTFVEANYIRYIAAVSA